MGVMCAHVLADLILSDAGLRSVDPHALADALGVRVARVPPVLIAHRDGAVAEIGDDDVALVSHTAPLRDTLVTLVVVWWLLRAGVAHDEAWEAARPVAMELLSRHTGPLSVVRRVG